MELAHTLPLLLALAWLLPLASFALIVLFGPRMGRAGYYAAYVATAAVVASFFLSLTALGLWLTHNPLAAAAGHEAHSAAPAASLAGDWYVLGAFGSLRVTVAYYIDSLTLAMFCMVTLVASCIHVYSFGYMHGELSEVFDTLAPWPTASRFAPRPLFSLLPIPLAVLLQHVGAGDRRQRGHGVRLLGVGGHLLLPADRLLARAQERQ